MITVSVWAILVAAVAISVLGMAWYHPRVFGSVWMRLANVTPETAERTRRTMALRMIVGLLAGMLMAYVLTFFASAWGVFDIVGAVELAFWLWVGFVVPPMLGMVLWEGKSMKLYFINALYWLVAIVITSVVVVW